MKKKILIALAALVLLALFLPVTTSQILYGDGDILSLDKEKIGESSMTVILKEVSSLTVTYKKSFTFNLDGVAYEVFESHFWDEVEDGPYQISQMFYDVEEDRMDMCSLIYDKELSFVVIRMEDHFYYLNRGADLTYQQLPIA